MGLKKRSLSLVGRGKPSQHRYIWWELVACGQERYTKKGFGFFGHVTWQASGWCETSISISKYKINRHFAGMESARSAINFKVAICDLKAPTAQSSSEFF
jgi:hypothetical protein